MVRDSAMGRAARDAILDGQTEALARYRDSVGVPPADAVRATNAAAVMVRQPDASDLVETIDQSWLDGVTVERTITLEEGQGIRGRFLGSGPPVELTDPVTGELKELGTWRIELRAGIVARLLDSARLRVELRSATLGRRVRIARLGTLRTSKGRNVTDYLVAWESDPATR